MCLFDYVGKGLAETRERARVHVQVIQNKIFSLVHRIKKVLVISTLTAPLVLQNKTQLMTYYKVYLAGSFVEHNFFSCRFNYHITIVVCTFSLTFQCTFKIQVL